MTQRMSLDCLLPVSESRLRVENAFGIRLFESIRGSLVLTEDGELFHADARKAVDQVLLA